ncbi:MAG: hypothetical protein J7J20_03210 [Desulfurococcales archaeon]|nr:hypothetical protein [Desulfurococcales archaeon]
MIKVREGKADVSIKGRFLRDVLLDLNLKSFTGRLCVRGKAPEGYLALRIHLVNGLPTYCLLNIEGGVLTGDKCFELASTMFCIDCGLELEPDIASNLIMDEVLVNAFKDFNELLRDQQPILLLKNPLLQLYMTRYSDTTKVMHESLCTIVRELETLSHDKPVLAIIKGSLLTGTLAYYLSRFIYGVLTLYESEGTERHSIRVINERDLNKIRDTYCYEVLDCTVYLIDMRKLKKPGFKL